MKKLRVILLITICIAIISTIVCYIFLSIPIGKCKVDGDIIENSSYFPGALARIDDKLYYNYYGNVFNSGVYEISENETNKIQSADLSAFIPSFIIDLPEFIPYENELILHQGLEISTYDIKTKNSSLLMANDIYYSYEIMVFEGKAYLYKDNKLYRYKDGDFEHLHTFDKKVLNYCVFDNVVYYAVKSADVIDIYKTKLGSNISDHITQLPNEYIANILVDENYIYITHCNFDNSLRKILQVNIINSKVSVIYENNLISPESIKENSEVVGLSSNISTYYNGNIYYGNNSKNKYKGLYVYNELTQSSKKLIDNNVRELYIIDSKYIYFVDNNDTLYRITQDGKSLEKVFG